MLIGQESRDQTEIYFRGSTVRVRRQELAGTNQMCVSGCLAKKTLILVPCLRKPSTNPDSYVAIGTGGDRQQAFESNFSCDNTNFRWGAKLSALPRRTSSRSKPMHHRFFFAIAPETSAKGLDFLSPSTPSSAAKPPSTTPGGPAANPHNRQSSTCCSRHQYYGYIFCGSQSK